MKSVDKLVTLVLVLLPLSIFTGCAMEPAAKNYLTESRQAKDARMQWWRQARFGMFIHWGVYADRADLQKYIAYMKAQVKELITEYDPAVLWFDGEWENTWNHKEGLKLYNYVRSLKPDIIINNRVDKGRKGMQGMTSDDTFAGDFGTPEQEIPHTGLPGVDWESCMTMNDHWGYNARDKNFKSAKQLISHLVDIVSKGGNYLLNVGPTAEGLIPAESVQRLQQMGKWMDVNGEAVYGTTAWDKAVYADVYTTLTRIDATIDFDWGNGPPDEKVSDNDFNITWTGTVVPKFSERYSFHTVSDDGVRLWIDGKKIIDNWTDHSATEDTGSIELKAGEKYSLKMEYYEKTGGAVAKLLFSSPGQPKQIVPADALRGGLTGIYKSKKPKDMFFMAKDDAVYAITTNWPKTELLFDIPKPSADTAVTLLGRDGNLKWKYNNGKIHIDVSDISPALLPCDHAWVFKMTPM